MGLLGCSGIEGSVGIHVLRFREVGYPCTCILLSESYQSQTIEILEDATLLQLLLVVVCAHCRVWAC